MTDQPDVEAEIGFFVHGHVQGVGFRWWTRRTARDLGVAGSVRNRPDGSVEVLARGTRDRLGELEARLHRGPPSARVERVERFSVTNVPGGDFVIEP